MNWILKIVPIDTLISLVESFLIASIKNPDSAAARRVWKIVDRLDAAIERFKAEVPRPL